MKKIGISVILAILIPFSVLVAGATAANFGTGPAKGSASFPSSVPGGVGYGGNGADYVYQAGGIPTALIINVPTKTTAYVGQTLTASFRLVRTDTNAGIPNAVVRGHFSRDGINWTEPGSVTTDGNGQCSYTGTVPDYPGTYQGYTSYDGNYTYQGCKSPIYTVTVLPQASPPALGPTPADSSPVASPTPADSSPVASPTPADSSLSTPLKSTPVSTNATTNMSTSFASSTDPSSSGSSPVNVMYLEVIALAVVALALAVIALAVIALAAVVVLIFRRS